MDHTVYKGRLERWNDDKGFGFVRPEDSSRDVFIHISALKGMSRRPVVGDMISFRVESDDKGRVRAVSASIVGVPRAQPGPSGEHRRNTASSFSLSRSILLAAVVAVAAYAYMGLDGGDRTTVAQETALTGIAGDVPETRSNTTRFSCDGRTYCSEMTSCEEARFFLQNCPGTKMDGDGDGVPCELQWCGP